MDKKRAHYWMCSQEEAWRTLQPSYIDVSWEKPARPAALPCYECLHGTLEQMLCMRTCSAPPGGGAEYACTHHRLTYSAAGAGGSAPLPPHPLPPMHQQQPVASTHAASKQLEQQLQQWVNLLYGLSSLRKEPWTRRERTTGWARKKKRGEPCNPHHTLM